jgi:hypothetical protein
MVFFWDEVPYLLDNIAKREGPAVAMEVLDVLRAYGQDHDRIRLLLTGSIGLHHVLADFKKQGYNGSPLNRMDHVQPGPLEPDAGLSLARALFAGQKATSKEPEACAATIAEAVGNVPFYIHKLVSRLPKGSLLTADIIAATLNREITADTNDWDLQHYRDRLRPYYADDELLALQVLDAVALQGTLSFQAIRMAANAQGPVGDEQLRNLLKLLCLDHYLIRTEGNEYRFYLTLIRRWWRLSRNL